MSSYINFMTYVSIIDGLFSSLTESSSPCWGLGRVAYSVEGRTVAREAAILWLLWEAGLRVSEVAELKRPRAT